MVDQTHILVEHLAPNIVLRLFLGCLHALGLFAKLNDYVRKFDHGRIGINDAWCNPRYARAFSELPY